MTDRKFLVRAGTAATLSLCAACGSANADVVSITSVGSASTDNLASYSGSIAYAPITGNTGSLLVTLTNTSPAANGGYLTGFVFNIGGADSSASAALSLASYASFLSTGSESAPPFGTYETGAALGANWTGGGSPSGGVPVGATGQFFFTVTASDAATLTASNFASMGSPYQFVARFRGFADGGSDKVPGIISGNEANVPAPAASIALSGLGGLLLTRRRR